MDKGPILKRNTEDWILEILSFLGLLGCLYPLLSYGEFEAGEVFPMHYNFRGEVDGWTDRSILWILPVISVSIYLILLVSERFYRKFTYPVWVNDDNKEQLYRLGVRMLRWLRLFIALLFAYIQLTGLQIARGDVFSLNPVIMGVFPVVLLGVCGYFYLKMFACRKNL